jgi:PAS domain S-box-containing protein
MKLDIQGHMPFDDTFSTLFDSFPDPVFLMDPEGTILDANARFAARFFKDPQECIGVNVYDQLATVLNLPGIAANRREKAREVMRTGKHLTFEDEHSGTVLRHSVYPIRSSDGEIVRMFVIAQDITEQKRAERDAHRNLAVFKALFDAVPGAVFIMDADGCLTGWNQYMRDTILDMPEDAMQGSDAFAAVHPDDLAKAREALLNVLKPGSENAVETRMLHQGKKEYEWRSIHGRKIMIDGELCVLCIGIDIDERKRIEDALVENRKRLTQALEAALAGIWEWDLKTGENIWSKELWSLSGLEQGSVQPSIELWISTIHPDDRDMVIRKSTISAENEVELNIEYRICLPDGKVRWIMSRGQPVYDSGGTLVRYIGTAMDITERKRIEEELGKSRARLDFTLETNHMGWWDLDMQDNTAHCTIEHDRIFGYDEPVAQWTYDMFLDHIVPEDRSEVSRVFRSTKEDRTGWSIEFRISRKDGEPRWIWAVGGYQQNHMSGIVQDITARKQAEEERDQLQAQLQQAQKMQLVGQLAGGIAHDFNNALAGILGNTEMLLERIDASHPFAKYVANIQKSALRSAELTRQLLAFSRKQMVTPKILDLNEEVSHILPMLRSLIGENIQFVWCPECQQAKVRIDTSQFDQIVTNLCINARDAITENGTITIETFTVQIDPSDCAAGHPCQRPGDYVRISVIDNGCGIDSHTLPHIFEPFFTTKEVGKGTGLGLSTVYGVVRQNNGYIDCRTTPGKGTTFCIYLPRYYRIEEQQETGAPETMFHDMKSTILVVEDEPYILKVIKEVLEQKGFTVLTAIDAENAFRIAGMYRGELDLLVTDIVLPKMNGVQLVERLHEEHPELKALFMSGYAPETGEHHRRIEEGVDFIQKPFTISDFLRIVYSLLRPPTSS